MMKFFKGRKKKDIFLNLKIVNVLEGEISGWKGCGKTSTTILKASRAETQELTIIQQ
jgi:hypothetical protein